MGLFAPRSPGSRSRPLEAAPAPAPGEARFSPRSWYSGEPVPLQRPPRLPAAQPSLLLRPVVLPLRHSYLIALPRLRVGGGGLAQPRDTHGSVSQIQPAGIWLLRVGASYSVAIPANRRPGWSGEAERGTPRELEIEESMMEKRWQRRGLARNLGRDSNMKECRP